MITRCAVVRLHATALTLGLVGTLLGEDLKPKTGLKPFQYQPAGFPMPNYLPGEKWGTEGEQITQMQSPLAPGDSALHVVVPEGFESTLWAADPEILKPITMAWDERGRLWIAETIDYPNELQSAGSGRDRIKICEDTNGDGRADKFTVFADKLSIPTGLCFANGGLIVIEGGQTLFLRDTNGDDQADERRTLFRGWGMGDTHATASNIRTGFDNWIWGVVGYSGFDGDVGGRRLKFGMGVFRFKPDGSALEFIRSSNNNTWGLGFSEEGTVFGSTANNNASWYMAVPNRFYETVTGWSATRMETIADSQQFYPVTQKVRQVDAHGRYTAGAGHALYTARSFPRDYWNSVAFVTEPTGHLIGKFRLAAQGSDFKAVNEHTFLASDDEWFAPIMAEVGPDGALWFIDWYNYIIQHNPTPHGFKNGKGNAYETPLRDKRHGRIYRVTHTGSKLGASPKLAGATPLDWVNALSHPNLLWRLHAQRLLVERKDESVISALIALTHQTRTDELGLSPGALHALWVLHGLDAIEDRTSAGWTAVRNALRHPTPSVRRTALNVLPRIADAVPLIINAESLTDSDAQVRLAAFLALAEMPGSENAGQAIAQALQEPRNGSDRWIRDAATSAGARHDRGFLKTILASTAPFPAAASDAVRIVARHYASLGPVEVTPLLKTSAQAPELVARAFIDGLATGWPEGRKLSLSPEDESALVALIKGLPDDARSALIALADRWERKSLFASEVAALSGRLQTQVSNVSLADESRVDAARRLLGLDDRADVVHGLIHQLTPLVSPGFSTGLLNALSTSREPSVAPAILGAWMKLTPAARRTALGVLLRRTEWASTVLSSLEAGKLHKSDLAGDQWNQLRRHANPSISERARAIEQKTGGGTATSTELAATIQKLLPLAQEKGDVVRGKEAFDKNCLICHALNGKGARIGPDLTGIGVRPKAELLVEVLDPNRSVEANYRRWTVTTKGGDTFAGRLDTETATSIEILDTTGQKHAIQRRDIATLEASNDSIMPGGFEQLPAADLAGLLEYLAESAHAKP